MKVRAHSRTSRGGTTHLVREHRRGTSFEFVPARLPVVENVRLYREPEHDFLTNVQILLSGMPAFVSVPDHPEDAPSTIRPRTVYIVKDYTPALLRRYPKVGREVSKRTARVLGHEALHLALARVESPATSRALDVPYAKFKTRSRGDISRGV